MTEKNDDATIGRRIGRLSEGAGEVMMLHRIRQIAERRPWVIAAPVVAVAVGLWFDLGVAPVIALVAYSALNAWGVVMHCDHLRERRKLLQRTLQLLAVALVPVGVLAASITPGARAPSETSTSGSPDEGIRRASIRAPAGGGSWRGR